jgi:hypothetical protein
MRAGVYRCGKKEKASQGDPGGPEGWTRLTEESERVFSQDSGVFGFPARSSTKTPGFFVGRRS